MGKPSAVGYSSTYINGSSRRLEKHIKEAYSTLPRASSGIS